MTLTEKSIHAFQNALMEGRSLRPDVARTLLSCPILADAQSCRFAQQPIGSTWNQIARAALTTSKGAQGNKLIRWKQISAADGLKETSRAIVE